MFEFAMYQMPEANLCEHGCGPTTASQRTAATMEERQFDMVLGSHFSQLLLSFVQGPTGRQTAAVLGAVGVAEHDDLMIVMFL